MTDDARFWDRIARKYAARPIADETAYEATLARTRAHLTPGARVLEVGCGTGTTALKLAPDVAEITATDLSSEMIAIAREKAEAAGVTNVHFEVAALDAAPSVAGGYDAVLAFNLLHLMRDVPAAIRALAALVRPGGVVISKSACVGETGWLLRRIALPVLTALGRAPSVTQLCAADVDDMVRRAGLDIVEAESFPGLAPTRFIVARAPGG